MTAIQRTCKGLMVVFGLLIVVFLASVYADTSETQFPADAKTLIASAGVALEPNRVI